MSSLVPGLIVAAVYVGFRAYLVKDKKLGQPLILEALGFAVVSCLAMWLYRTVVLREGMETTYGETCPNGYIKIVDPVNSKQETCVPSGSKTYPPNTGFSGKQLPDQK